MSTGYRAWFLGISLALLAAGPVQGAAPAAYPPGLADTSPPTVIHTPDVTLTAQTAPLCTYQRKLDGQWLGSYLASDGKVYFGSSSHSGDTAGMFFQYDPTERVKGKPPAQCIFVLSGDLSITCGENAKTMVPQGKIHSIIVEHDGWLYFATHLAAYWSSAENRYTGSHVLAYKLGSREAGKPVFRDFGVTRENHTCYAGIAVDGVNGYVYTMVTRWWNGGGGYLYRFKTDGTGKTLITSFASEGGGTSFYLFPDRRGDLWFTQHGNFGALYKLDGKTGNLACLTNALPVKRQLLADKPSMDKWGRAFRWAAKVDGDRCVFSMHTDGGLWEFDASKVRGSDATGAFRQLHFIGQHGLGTALGGDTVYFVQSADPNWTHPEAAADHHLKSISLDPAASLVDHGRLIDGAGRTPFRIGSLCADAKGNVYGVGDWRVGQTEVGSDLSSLSYDPAPKNPQYFDMWRGQFFSSIHVDVAPAPSPQEKPR